MRIVTVVPSPGVREQLQAVIRTEGGEQTLPGCWRPRARFRGALAAQSGTPAVGRIHTDPVVGNRNRVLRATVFGTDRYGALACLSAQTVLYRVLDEWLKAQERQLQPEDLGLHAHREFQLVAEARLFQLEVAVDAAQLLRERGHRSVAAERVAGEVGELQQQFTGT